MASLKLLNIWTAPGYRTLTLTLVDPVSRKEARVHLSPEEVQRLVCACGDAVQQIGTEGPIDWDQYPRQIYWPQVTPWKAGPRRIREGCHG